jgi:hypothetical protein
MSDLPSYTAGRPADWSLIPYHMIGGLRLFIEDGIPPGSFLTALLSNDLRETFARADEENSRSIKNWLIFLYNYAPSDCWGSPAKFNAWIERGGLNGRSAADQLER